MYPLLLVAVLAVQHSNSRAYAPGDVYVCLCYLYILCMPQTSDPRLT